MSINNNSILLTSKSILRTLVSDSQTMLFDPDSLSVIMLNSNTIRILDICSIPITFALLIRRLEMIGLNPTNEELSNIIENLNNSGILLIDGSENSEHYSFSPMKYLDIPVLAAIHTTYNCNLDCKYCYNSSIRNNSNKRILNLEQWYKVINNLVDHGIKKLTVTGGEPLLRTDILEIFREKRQNGCITDIITNGTLINEDNISIIGESFNTVVVSLDSSEEAENDYYRGQGTYKKVIEGIELLVDNNIPVVVNTTLTSSNIETFSATKTFLENIGVINVKPSPMHIKFIEMAEYRPTLAQLELFKETMNLNILDDCGSYKEAIEKGKIFGISPRYSCGAAFSECAVGPEGNLFPCRSLMDEQFCSGSLLDHKFEYLWNNSDVFKRIREFDPHSIRECDQCEFINLCFGACRGQAYDYSGVWDGWIGPFRCHLSKHEITQRLKSHIMAKVE